MTPAREHLAAGVSTGWSGLSAREPDAGLTAGAEPVQRERTGRAGTGVTDDITGVMSAGQQLPARSSTFVLRTGAGPGSLGLTTAAALYTGLVTRPAVSRVTNVRTGVLTTAESPATLPATTPRS